MLPGEDGEVTVLRHEDGCYSLAIGVPRDYAWTFHVVGHYPNRAEANAAIAADRKLNPSAMAAGCISG